MWQLPSLACRWSAMEKTTSLFDLSSLGDALGSLGERLSPEQAAAVLKFLVCVGEIREKVLEGLEKKSGQKFDGNLWKAVEWLEGEGVDVRNTPRMKSSSPADE